MSARAVRRCGALVTATVLLLGAAAQAEVLPQGSVRALPDRAGSASMLAVHASFDQPAAAQLLSYDLDFARGLSFDLRAVAGRCTAAQARATMCPTSSRFANGTTQVSVGTKSTAPQRFNATYSLYLMRPPRRGDLAGVALIARRSGFGFTLVGPLVRVQRGPYGTELQFRNIASQLPPGLVIQVHRVDARFGTQRTVVVHTRGGRQRRTYALFTNPSTCTTHGWPLLLTWGYSSGTDRYKGVAACRPAK